MRYLNHGLATNNTGLSSVVVRTVLVITIMSLHACIEHTNNGLQALDMSLE